MSADYRRIAAHALLPGLAHAVEISLAALNETRAEIGLPALYVQGEGAPTVAGWLAVTKAEPEPEVKKRGRPKGSKNRTAAAASADAAAKGMTSADRWRVVKEAGIKTRHAPNAKHVERALKLLAKRAAAEAPKVMSAGG